MRFDELSAGNGRGHGNFTRQQSRGSNFGKFESAALSRNAQHFQALSAGSKRGAAAHRGYGQRGQGHTYINLFAVNELEIGNASGRVHNVGHILAAGNKERRKAVRVVRVVADGMGLHMS